MSRFELCKFYPTPDQELICGICMNVLDTPYETPCRHVFCRGCIWTALRESQKCPVCRAYCVEDRLKEVLPLVQNLINKLTMKCDNNDRGCTELILKEFFLDHIKSCGYALVQCRYKDCGQHLLRKDCEEHETMICVYRDRLCEGGCGLMIPVENLESHNCMEALVTLVKDLKDKNLELHKKIDELQQAPQRQVNAKTPFPADVNMEDWPSYASFTSADNSVNFSSDSWSSYDVTDVELSDLEYDGYRTDRRRSRRLAALSFDNNFESTGSVALSDDSQQLPNSQTPRNDDNHNEHENADRIIDIDELDGANNEIISEYQVVEEINYNEDGHSESDNGYIDDIAVSSEICSQTAEDSATSTFVLDFSDCVVSPSRNNESHFASPGKRLLEDSSDADTVRKKMKRSEHSHEQNETQPGETTFASESLSGSNTSNTESPVVAKKHPHGHKKTKPESSLAADSQTSSISGSSTSVPDEAGNISQPTISAQNTRSRHASGPDYSDSINSLNSNTGNRNNSNSLTRRGPVTRSRGQDQHIVLEDNVIPYVKVPPSVAYLLNKYAGEDDSSDDESWSPSHEK